MKQRRITKSGGITLPTDIRRDMGFTAGTPVDIVPMSGTLVIRQRVPRCTFCQSTEGVSTFRNKTVCKACAIAIQEVANG